MRSFLVSKIQPHALHHAYCLEGQGCLPGLLSFLEKDLSVATHGNPDFWQGDFEVFGIDEGRMVKELQQRMSAIADAKKIFIISAQSITHEAQNSLLKVFEEPSADTHFFLLLPSAELLLPTLRSRLMIVRMPKSADAADRAGASSGVDAKTFLKAKPAERMAMVEPLIEEKDKSQALAFVDSLIKELSRNSQVLQANAAKLEDLLASRDYLTDRASSVKIILGHIALTL